MVSRAQQTVWSCPPVPPATLERPVLLARIDQALRRPLTWITAPAGFGKSVLVAQWSRRRNQRPIAWFDAGADGARGTELTVLRRAITHLADGDREPVDAESASLTAIAVSCPPAILVIDGCRSETLASCVLDLAAALEPAQTDGLRIIVTSRAAPPDRSAALALRGACTVIHPADLALTSQETAAVINELVPGSIDATTAREIDRQLQGWAAGARLVGLHYRGPAAPSATHLLDAAARAIEGYLGAELIADLGDDERRFLLLTAAVDQPSPGLCDAMTGATNSERMLLRLDRAGLPMSRDATAGALAHVPIIRAALDRIAAREVPSQRAVAVRAAAEWYGRHGQPFEAAWLLVGLEQWDAVIEVVFLHLQQILESDQIGRLAELAAAAPVEVIRGRAELALGVAYLLRMDGRVAAAMELLAVFDRYMGPVGRAIADVTRSGIVSSVPDVAAALAYADAGIAACDELDDDWADVAHDNSSIYSPATQDTYRTIARSYALLACAYAGVWDRGPEFLTDVAPSTAAALPQIQIIQRHGSRATYLALSGRAGLALHEARTGVTVAETAGMRDHRVVADARYGHGEALRLMLRYDEADEAFAVSHELASLNGRSNLLASITASRGHLAVDRGDPRGAISLLDAFRREGYRPPITLDGLIAAAEARARLAVGQTASALHLLEDAPWTAATACTLVTTYASLGQISNARAALERWPHRSTADATVRFHLAAALVHESAGQRPPADAAFATALDLAASDRLLQPFAEGGAVAMQLLQRTKPGNATAAALDLAVTLRAATMEGASAATAAMLTTREASILGLLATDMTVQAIAQTVHLSPNTVKTHLKSLYRKLGVSSRADAVRAAQQSGRSGGPVGG